MHMLPKLIAIFLVLWFTFGCKGYNCANDTSTDEQKALVKSFVCTSAGLTVAPDFTAYTSLEILGLSYNDITSIDISNNLNLEELYLTANQFSSVDSSNNVLLKRLFLNDNLLTAVDFTNNTLLQALNVSGNQLTAIGVSNNTALTSLIVRNNQVSDLNLAANSNLTQLDASFNNVSSIDVSNNPNLTELYVCNCPGDTQTTDGKACPYSNETVICPSTNVNRLTGINLINNTGIQELALRGNHIQNISDINLYSGEISLSILNLENNQIVDVTSLDLDAPRWSNLISVRLKGNPVDCSTIKKNICGVLNVGSWPDGCTCPP